MLEDDLLRQKLEQLRSEHRDMDEVLANVSRSGDQLAVQRMKKRKLLLKDQIAQLESRLVPDIIA